MLAEGAFKNIIKNVVNFMLKDVKKDIIAVIGPCIQKKLWCEKNFKKNSSKNIKSKFFLKEKGSFI